MSHFNYQPLWAAAAQVSLPRGGKYFWCAEFLGLAVTQLLELEALKNVSH